jgi:hypothetical protein
MKRLLVVLDFEKTFAQSESQSDTLSGESAVFFESLQVASAAAKTSLKFATCA